MPKRTDISKILIIGSGPRSQGLKPRMGRGAAIVAPKGATFQNNIDLSGAAKPAPRQKESVVDSIVAANDATFQSISRESRGRVRFERERL